MKYLLTEIPKTFMTLLSTGLLPTGLFQALGCRLAISITGGRPGTVIAVFLLLVQQLINTLG